MTILKLTKWTPATGETSPLVLLNPDNLFIQASELKHPGPVIIGEPSKNRSGSALSNGVNHTFVTETPEEIYSLLMSERMIQGNGYPASPLGTDPH